MATAEAATKHPSQLACECGGDHRGTESRGCPVFEIPNFLNKRIEEFLNIRELVEFGKDGPMARCLRSTIARSFMDTKRHFIEFEDVSEKHPEWHLSEEISRLRRYFEQISDSCTVVKATSDLNFQTLGLPGIIEDNKTTSRPADRALIFYGTCNEVIEEYVRSGALLLSCTKTHQGYLSRVDKGFKDIFETIIVLPTTENSVIQALMKKAYEIWKECRRLLCEYQPSPRKIVP